VRFCHARVLGQRDVRLAVSVSSGLLFVDEVVEDAPATLQSMLAGGEAAVTAIRSRVSAALAAGASTTPEAEIEFAPAVVDAPSILAVGLNYATHAAELGFEVDNNPTIFGLLPGSVSPHMGTTEWSRSLTDAVDYEVELGVVIGRDALNVSEADALDHVFGYTVVNDITARDIQHEEKQWLRCKSFDGFTPVGPVVVTADEMGDPQNLALMLTVNGQVLQSSTTGDMMRTVAKLISHLSQGSTLTAGTLISTGTPEGAGYTRTPQVLLGNGDVIEATIEGIGTLVTHCRTTD
jgi:ureidoglycolate lyase